MKTNPIEKYRIDNGLSGPKFAKRAGVGVMTMWRACNNKGSLSVEALAKIAKAMNIKPGTLVNRMMEE
jgi:transcriptional regulator with XRE-family HTH domain